MHNWRFGQPPQRALDESKRWLDARVMLQRCPRTRVRLPFATAIRAGGDMLIE
jgi:hypothetical protein